MHDERRGGEHSPEQSAWLARLKELQAQVEPLPRTIRDLEEQRKKDAREMAEAQAELKEYRRLVCQWAGKCFREEDWNDFREEDYTISMDEVLAELEKWEQQ